MRTLSKYNSRCTSWKLSLVKTSAVTFEEVIDALMDLCDMEFEQAEQCADIANNKGEYAFKVGSFQQLNFLKLQFKNSRIPVQLYYAGPDEDNQDNAEPRKCPNCGRESEEPQS